MARPSARRYVTSSARHMSVESTRYAPTDVARSIRLRSTRGLAYEAKVAFQSGAGVKPSPSAVVDRIDRAPGVSYSDLRPVRQRSASTNVAAPKVRPGAGRRRGRT